MGPVVSREGVVVDFPIPFTPHPQDHLLGKTKVMAEAFHRVLWHPHNPCTEVTI